MGGGATRLRPWPRLRAGAFLVQTPLAGLILRVQTRGNSPKWANPVFALSAL